MKGLFCGLLVAGLLAGCTSRVYVQRSEGANMAKYRTYSWVATKAHKGEKKGPVSAFADIAVRNAVREALEQQGWKEVNRSPEVLLGYDILVERTGAEPKAAEVTQPFTRVYYNPYLRRWGAITYPGQFSGYHSYAVPLKEATLSLSMMNAATDEALWQGWTTERINTARLTEEEIQKSVKSILRKLQEQ